MGDKKTIQYFIDFFKSKFNADKHVVESDPDNPAIVFNIVYNHDKSKKYSITHKDTEYVLGFFKRIKVSQSPQRTGTIDCFVYFNNIGNVYEIYTGIEEGNNYFDLTIPLTSIEQNEQTTKTIYKILKDTIFDETDAPKEEESKETEQSEQISTAECVGNGCGRWWGGGKSAKKQKKRRSKRTKRNRKSRSNKRKIKN
jgi:hypothetical protein